MDRDAHALLAGIETFLRGEAKKHARKARSHGRRVEADDLYQEGVLAALSAVPRYDPSRCNFWTFAATRVRGAMFDAIGGTLLANRRQMGHAKARGLAMPAVGGLPEGDAIAARPAAAEGPLPGDRFKAKRVLWYAAGKCSDCGARRRRPGSQMCKACARRRSRYRKRAYRAKVRLVLCRKNACKSPPAPGRVLCPAHLAAASLGQRTYQGKAQSAKPPGACNRGACPDPAAAGRKMCGRHLAMQRKRTAAYQAKARGSDSTPGEVAVA
jgi:RNA polymerase sigma factor (sigma-70 family)